MPPYVTQGKKEEYDVDKVVSQIGEPEDTENEIKKSIQEVN